MLLLEGTVLGLYETPVGQRQDGTRYGGDHKVQLLCVQTLKNDEEKNELVTLTAPDLAPWKPFQGANVRVAVSAYCRNGAVAYVLQNGAIPTSATGSSAAPKNALAGAPQRAS